MATVILDDGSLYDIADAIRSKLGVSTTYLPREMAEAIMSIETSSVVEGYYYDGGFYEDSSHTDPITGESGKLYVDLSDGGLYRWNGSSYVEIASSLQLGETSTTAYRGDRGKVAYDHATAKGSAYSSGLYKVTTNSEGHVTNATAVQKSDITGLGIPAQDTTYTNASESSSGLMSASDKAKLNAIASGATANTASSATPLMDGTASAGSSDAYARGDHRHPTDTTRASTAVATTSANGLMSSTDKSKLDSIDTSALVTATANANNAAQSANTAATAANTAASSANDAAERAEDAIDAIGDISEQAVPLMSESTRGGATLGHGLAVEDGALGIGSVTDPTDAGPIVELTAKGWAEQDTTSGKNLIDENGFAQGGINGSTGEFNSNDVVRIRSNTAFPVSPSTQYVLTYASGYKVELYEYDANGTYLAKTPTWRTSGYVITTQANTAFMAILVGETNDARITPSIGASVKAQLELGSTATSYEPYSGAAPSPSPSYPQEIRRCRGRNLLDPESTAVGNYRRYVYATVEPSSTYTISVNHLAPWKGVRVGVVLLDASDTATDLGWKQLAASPSVIQTNADTKQVRLLVSVSESSATVTTSSTEYTGTLSADAVSALCLQLEAGSVATPYVTYGCVGVNVTHDGTTITIPIPLPERGYVAALPDGTCDTLTLDGAGGYVWELATWMDTIDGTTLKCQSTTTTNGSAWVELSHLISYNGYNAMDNSTLCDKLVRNKRAEVGQGTQGIAAAGAAEARCLVCVTDMDTTSKETVDTWLQSNPLTVLYKLATPTTESGYVTDFPTVPVHASISSVDLDSLAVRCCADEGAAEIASAWGRRYESRIAALEDAVAELVANG